MLRGKLGTKKRSVLLGFLWHNSAAHEAALFLLSYVQPPEDFAEPPRGQARTPTDLLGDAAAEANLKKDQAAQ